MHTVCHSTRHLRHWTTGLMDDSTCAAVTQFFCHRMNPGFFDAAVLFSAPLPKTQQYLPCHLFSCFCYVCLDVATLTEECAEPCFSLKAVHEA